MHLISKEQLAASSPAIPLQLSWRLWREVSMLLLH